MPSTGWVESPSLSIALAGSSRQVFQTGDIIIGKVVRRQHIVMPDCRVTIRLVGRSKVKLVIWKQTAQGQSKNHTYRSRYDFFGWNAHKTSQILHSGPLHIAAGQADAAEFPFAVKIPTHPSAQLSLEADKGGFLPTDAASVVTQPLPPSYQVYRDRHEAYVEYWLEARLTPGLGTNNKAATPALSTQPVLIGARPCEPPSRAVGVCASAHTLTSYKLDPAMNQVQLSFNRKLKQFFHAHSVPSLRYSIHVGLPVAMQLQAHNSVPLTLRLSSKACRASDNACKTVQKATINSIAVYLTQYTDTRPCPVLHGDIFSERTSQQFDLRFDKVLNWLPTPMVVDVDPDGESIDLGTCFDIRLTEWGFYSGRQALADYRFTQPITPSFTTYNISVTHALKIKTCLTICGKKHCDTFKADTRIMPHPAPSLAAKSTSKPCSHAQTEAGPALPSFAEAMEENTKDDGLPEYKPGPNPEVAGEGKHNA